MEMVRCSRDVPSVIVVATLPSSLTQWPRIPLGCALMPIYEFAPDRIQPLTKTTFGAMQLHERRDLQRLLRENIEVIAPDTLVIAEEYGEWD